jgi:hypothetical protein
LTYDVDDITRPAAFVAIDGVLPRRWGCVFFWRSECRGHHRHHHHWTWDDLVTVTSSGNVGIGTASPDASTRLHVVSAGATASSNIQDGVVAAFERSQSTAGAYVAIIGATNGNSALFFGDTDDDDVGNITYNHTSNFMNFDTAGTERMRIDSSGNLGIGTTSPSSRLHISGTGGLQSRIENTGNTGSDSSRYIIKVGGTSAGDPYIDFLVNGGSEYSLGIDNSDSDKFKLSASGALGTGDLVTVTSTGNVGIGTTSPDRNLDVQGTGDTIVSIVSPAANQVALFFGDTDSDAIGRLAYDNSDNSMRFTTNATERLRIDSSGRLLVNTTASRAQAGLNLPLFVEGTNYTGIGACYNAANSTGSFLALSKSRGAANGSNTIVNNNDQIGEIYFSAADGTDLETRAATIAAFVDGVPGSNDMPGRLVFSTTADGAATPTERLRITSAGNVGIGTSSPTYKLQVSATDVAFQATTTSNGTVAYFNCADASAGVGNIIATFDFSNDASMPNGGHYIQFQQQGAERGAITLFDNNSIALDSLTNLAFQTAGSERMRIDSNGDVGIGTTSPSTWSKLAVSELSNTDFTGITSINPNAGTGIAGIQFASDANYAKAAIGLLRQGVNGTGILAFYNDGVGDAANWSTGDEKMRINQSGNVGIATTAPDAKLTVNGVASFAAGTALLPSIARSGDLNTGVWFPAGDTIAASTNGTERLRIDSSGNLKFDSGFGSVATAYGCRAWVNFNGTGTVAIREDGNVSSITDHTTGEYTVNFTTAMSDANYSAVGLVTDWHICLNSDAGVTTSSCRFYVFSDANGTRPAVDESSIHIAVFR